VAHQPDASIVLRRLRWPDTCSRCGLALPATSEAWWDRRAKEATCRQCKEGSGLAFRLAGTAGGSAAREYERRHANRQAALQARFGPLARVVDAVTNDPRSTTSWAKGASGEARLGAFLERELTGTAIVLHDRRVPNSKANIDHIAVAPSGIWVIDAKSYRGKVERRTIGSFWNPRTDLYVGGRRQNDCADAARLQIGVVARTVGARDGELPLRPTLCFVDSDWGLFPRPFVFHEVFVTWPQELVKKIRGEGPLDSATVAWTAARLATALPPA
jgi:hypothetical protein